MSAPDDRPRAAVLSVGSEILLGDLTDTNARWLSGRLTAHGLRVVHHLAVADDLDAIVAGLRWLADRADLIVVGGGLGPTADDLTREAIAAAADVDLERRPELEAALEERFRRRGRAVTAQNLRQAQVPAGALVYPAVGTAPGFALDLARGTRVVALPGVPWEMRELFSRHVVDEIRALGPARATVTRRVYVSDLGESDVASRVEPVVLGRDDVELSMLAHASSIEVRLTATERTPQLAHERAQPAVDAVCATLGEHVAGVDDDTLETVVLRALTQRSQTLALAESATAGAIGARLGQVAGASAVFRGGVVVYATRAKHDLLGVPSSLLERHGSVGEVITRELAERVRKVADADWGLAVTGVAGPAWVDGLEPGTCFWALAAPDGTVEVAQRWLPGDRQQVVTRLGTAALDLLRRRLAGA